MEKVKKNKAVIFIIIILLAIIGVFVLYNAFVFQTTDDAYIETTTVSVAPKVSGEIIEVYVKDSSVTEEGKNGYKYTLTGDDSNNITVTPETVFIK